MPKITGGPSEIETPYSNLSPESHNTPRRKVKMHDDKKKITMNDI